MEALRTRMEALSVSSSSSESGSSRAGSAAGDAPSPPAASSSSSSSSGSSSPSVQPLPPGWTTALSLVTGREYYIHKRTGQSTYERPVPASTETEIEMWQKLQVKAQARDAKLASQGLAVSAEAQDMGLPGHVAADTSMALADKSKDERPVFGDISGFLGDFEEGASVPPLADDDRETLREEAEFAHSLEDARRRADRRTKLQEDGEARVRRVGLRAVAALSALLLTLHFSVGCGTLNCGPHGECSGLMQPICTCVGNHAGPHCEHSCGAHGSADGAAGQCACDDGWHEPSCSMAPAFELRGCLVDAHCGRFARTESVRDGAPVYESASGIRRVLFRRTRRDDAQLNEWVVAQLSAPAAGNHSGGGAHGEDIAAILERSSAEDLVSGAQAQRQAPSAQSYRVWYEYVGSSATFPRDFRVVGVE